MKKLNLTTLFNQLFHAESGANLNLFRYAAMLVMLFSLAIGNAWGSSNYYASLKITKSGPTGAGSVYVANSNSKPGSDNAGTAVKSSATTSSGGNVTMYWWVDINPGYNVTLSGKVTGGPYSAASANGNVSCKASTSANGEEKYTATATFVAVTVNSVSPASVALDPTNPSADYPFTVTFGTSNLKTIAIDLDKSPESADGKFTITNWALDGTNVVATGKFNGGGTYGGASRNNSTTISLKSKASGSTAKTCTVTANFPALAFVDADVMDVYTTQNDATKTGSADFNFNYGAEDDFPTAPSFTHTSGDGAFTVTGYEVTPDFSKGTCKVTVNYSFNPNGVAGTTKEELKITSVGGLVASATITGEAEAEATDDAKVIAADGETLIYQGDWATALGKANTAANAGCTLVILRDVSGLTAYQEVKNTFTLDLNGKKLTGKYNGSIIYVNSSGKTLTIKDTKTGGRVENINNAYSGIAYCVNVNAGNLILESGTLYCENKGASGRRAFGINQVAGTTITMNGGRVEGQGYGSSYGLYQASNKNNNTTFTMNGGEIYEEGYSDIYAICAYGKVNINDGTISALATYSNCRGIHMTASSNATPANCYWGTLTMKGGTVNSTCTANADGTRYAYGVFFETANTAMGTATATDGSHANKASSTGTIENATINASTLGRYSYGVRAYGSYQSKTNTYDVIQIKNSTINSTAQYYYTYGVMADGDVNGTHGAVRAANIELTNCIVNATTTKYHTAYAVWATAFSNTVYKNAQPNYYGEYAGGATVTVNSGTYTATTGTTYAYAIGTSARAKTTYGSNSNVTAERTLGGNAEEVATLNIHGGKFIANAGTTTARAVSNGGNCTIDGGEFEATAGTTTADGIYTVSGKLKASGVKITASATGTAYGVRVDAANVPYNTDAAWTGFNYAGDAELNNLDVTVTARTGATAYGVYVNATAYQYTQSAYDTYMQGRIDAGKVTQANADIWAAVFPGNSSYAIGAKAVINGGTYTVSTATTSAYGVWMKEEQVAADKQAHAAPEASINNAKFTVTTNGTTTAYGVYSGGNVTIDGCDFTVQPKTTTAYGVYQYSNKATITNTKFDVKGTTTAHGFYANAAISGTHGWDYHGEFELGEDNDVTVAATSGDAAHVMTLIASKKNINVDGGAYNGDYANAASALVTGGSYKATATGAKSYVLNLSDQQVQGDVISRPACIIEDGKFWALASGGTTGIVSANGQIGSIVLKGGFYNVNTNLGKYKEEGKNINDVPAGAPEYTEGYRYEISSELSGGPVCKVYQGNTLKQSYATLEEALQFVNANTGTNYTIVMVADYMLKKGDYILPNNATLIVPSDLNQKSETANNKPTRQNVNTPAPVQLVMLTFDNGVNMTVKGAIETTAVNTAANGGSAITGAPTGNYGRLHLSEGSTITLESGSKFNCWGYCTGKGEINALSGSTVREGFQLGYWRGGSATSSMLNNKSSWHAFPVTDYFIQNVEAPITFRPGASLLGYSGVNVSVLGIQAANDVKLVGTSASMFLMEEKDASEDTYVRKEYDPETDRAIWTVNSGAKIGSFSFSLAGNTVNSEDYYLPISNNMTIYVNEGEFTVTQDALLIPGAQVIISKLGKLTVASGKRLFVMDNEDWPGFLKSGTTTVSRWYYNALYSPSWTTNPRTLKYPPTTTRLPDGEIFVHGETEGSYYTSTSGANIHSTNDDAGKVKFVANAGADNSIQHVVNTDNERVTINFTTAQLKNETPETPYTSSKNTVAGEAFVYMEQQWVKVTDGCLTTRTDGSGTHEYAKPSDVVEVVSNGDNAYRDVATGTRYFINAVKPLTGENSDECVWWEVEPVTSGTYAGDYMANQEKYENYGAYYYWDGTAGYWKPRYVTVTWKNQNGTTLATYTNVMCNTSPKYLSASPTWANTSVEKHDWVGWRDADGNIYDKNAVLPVAQGNVTYTAYYNVSKYEYTIKFVNPDNTVIWAGLVEAGTVPECPVAPTQAPTASTVYTFTGWNTTLAEVTGTATYTAVYASSTRKYHVTFYNYDAQTVLYEADVDYNTRPEYGGVTPFRANTSSFSYEWKGWQKGSDTYDTDDDLALVTGNVNYIATYSQTDLKYQVFFKRQDGSVIDAPLFNYEETPAAFPANPTLASTVSTDYTFDHWEPAELVPVTEEGKVYTAYFSESPRQYTAHFVNYDGKTLNVDQTIDYNTVPAYTGATPFKPNDSRNSFEFAGWAWEAGDGWSAGSVGLGEALPAITGNITFTAQFNELPLQFNVIYQREDGTFLKQDKVKWGQTTTAPAAVDCNYEDEQYTYTLSGWSPATIVNPVTTDATYTAQYTATPKSYDVTLNTNSGTINAGDVSSYTYGVGATLPTNVTRTGYDFSGWYDNSGLTGSAVENISANATGDKEYWARWTIMKFTVKWKNEDGSTLETDTEVPYGTEPTYDGAIPTKAADASYVYTFDKWSPAVGSISGNTEYVATYTSVPTVASVTSNDGTTYHATIADAISTANTKSGATVTMLQNESTTELTITATMTIDLNGKTISSTQTTAKKAVFKIDATGQTVTIADNGTGGKIDHTAAVSGHLYGINLVAGELNVTGGNIYVKNNVTTDNSGYRTYAIFTPSSGSSRTINISGGTIEAYSPNCQRALGICAYDNLTMTGGTVIAEGNTLVRGIWVQNTTTSLSGVTVTATATSGYSYAVVNKAGTMTINSGTYTATGTTDTYAVQENGGTVNIIDGKFSGSTKEFNKADGTASIEGGYYVHNTDLAAMCAENYHVLPASLTEGGITYYNKVAEAYTVTFNENGHGTAPASQLIEKGQKASQPTAPSATGYTFGGWYKESSCTNAWNFESDVVTGPTTLYAKWILNKYTFAIGVTPAGYGIVNVSSIPEIPHGTTVTKNGNQFTVNGTTVTATPAAQTAQYIYAFKQWNNVPAIVTSNVTNITAEFTRTLRSYDVTYDMQGHGEAITKQTIEYDSKATAPAAPSATGYTFGGWYKESSCTNAWNFESDVVTGPTTLYAKWTPIAYNITYKDKDGAVFSGTHGSGYPTTHTYGTATALVNPTKTNNAFKGWFTNEQCSGDPITSIGATAYTNNITLYAKWIATYTVTWKDGTETIKSELWEEGTIPSFDYHKDNTAQYTYDVTGWSPDISAVSGDATYTAIYTATVRSYTIRFVKDDNATVIQSSTLQYGATPSAPVNPVSSNEDSRITHTFIGWKPSIRDVDGPETYVAQYQSDIIASENSSEPIVIESEQTVEVITTTVETTGKLQVEQNATLTTNTLILQATAGDGDADNATSGEITGAEYINTENTDVYYDLTLNTWARHWHAFGVPWKIGSLFDTKLVEIKDKQGNDCHNVLILGRDYDIIYYNGEKRAAQGPGRHCWDYVEDGDGTLTPGKAYMIGFIKPTGTVRFAKAADAAITTNSNQLDIPYYEGNGSSKDAGWNAIANPKTYHANMNAGVQFCHVHNADTMKSDGFTTVEMSTIKFVVGKAVYVQTANNQTTTVAISHATSAHAPRRSEARSNTPQYYAVHIMANGKSADRIYVKADEDKEENIYTNGIDVAKMGVSTVRAQMWIERYDTKLAVNTMAPVNNTAVYPLGISIPQAGEYEISSPAGENGDMLYLTYDGRIIWNLTYAPYSASFEKGTNTHYGLKLVRSNAPAVTTEMEQSAITDDQSQIIKVLIDDKVYILRGGEIYTITGQKAN